MLACPSGMPRVKPDLDAGTAQYDRIGHGPPDLVWLYDEDVILIERPHSIDPSKIRRTECVIRIHQNDEGGEQERRHRNKYHQSDGKAPKTVASRRRVIGSRAGRRNESFHLVRAR
jgi:hypothetical protein